MGVDLEKPGGENQFVTATMDGSMPAAEMRLPEGQGDGEARRSWKTVMDGLQIGP